MRPSRAAFTYMYWWWAELQPSFCEQECSQGSVCQQYRHSMLRWNSRSPCVQSILVSTTQYCQQLINYYHTADRFSSFAGHLLLASVLTRIVERAHDARDGQPIAGHVGSTHREVEWLLLLQHLNPNYRDLRLTYNQIHRNIVGLTLTMVRNSLILFVLFLVCSGFDVRCIEFWAVLDVFKTPFRTTDMMMRMALRTFRWTHCRGHHGDMADVLAVVLRAGIAGCGSA